MPSITVDANLSLNLRRATGAVELRDERGEVIGIFAPFFRSRDEFNRFVRRMLPSPEELRRQKATPEKTYTTEEVKAYLRSLGSN